MLAEGTSFLYLKKWRGNSGKKMAAARREAHNSLEKGRKVGLLMSGNPTQKVLTNSLPSPMQRWSSHWGLLAVVMIWKYEFREMQQLRYQG